MSGTKTIDLDFVSAPASEAINNKETKYITETSMDVGQFFPQGDVALVKLAKVPKGCTRVEKPSLQVVEGVTQGSQHCWDSLDGVEVWELPQSERSPLKGHVYSLKKERTLTHPEHGHHVYHAGFIGQVIYQRQFAEELKRMQD